VKLTGPQAMRYLARPDPAHAGLLIFGADGGAVAMRRQEAVAALVGPEGEAEMRLTRMSGADLRRDGAALSDAMRAQGFFPGHRVVLVDDATDGLADVFGAAFAEWRPGDAQIVATSGQQLPAKSALRGVFEGHRTAMCIGLYDDPPTEAEIEAELARAGLARPLPAAAAELAVLARTLDPAEFRQTLERVALYKLGDEAPLTPEEVGALAPLTVEAGVDEVIAAAADGRTADLVRLMARLTGQGVSPVTVCIAALRHFRGLHAMVSDPGGPEAGIGRLRPPPPWKAREGLLAQARRWRPERVEAALALIVETDLTLRSASRAPQAALLERALIRVAMSLR
jgi:DNA polymerase-3 subunit delta